MRKVYIDFMGNKKYLFALSGVLLVISLGALLVPRPQPRHRVPRRHGHDDRRDGRASPRRRSRDALKKEGIDDAVVQTQQNGAFLVRTGEADTAKAHGRVQHGHDRPRCAEGGRQRLDHRSGLGRQRHERGGARARAVARRDPALHLAALRVQDVDHGGRGTRARRHHHARHLRARGPRGHAEHGRRAADDPRVLAVRHDRRVPPHPRERPAHRRSSRSCRWRTTRSTRCSCAGSTRASARSSRSSCCWSSAARRCATSRSRCSIGLVSGAYSSIAVASPLYAIWKEREPKFQALKKKYA